MPLLQMEMIEIAELGTQVAVQGALRAGEFVADDLFDLIVSIAILIYELSPGG